MQIGSVTIPGNLTLAPMAAYTSWPFRRICRRFGAALVTTEVIKARELVRRMQATFDYISFKPDEHPIAGQFMSGDPAEAADAAAVMNELGFDMVDLNLGCPKRRVISDGLGGAMMEFPEKVEQVVAAMVKASRAPVTVKMRAGRWKGEVTAVETARRCEAAGAAALCVHPRFSEGAAVAPPDWEVIAQVKQAVKIPVIGNGGIHVAADVQRMFRDTGCDAVAIGQAAVGRPWIFRQAPALMATGVLPPAPPDDEIRAILLEHYRGLIELHGERKGTIMMRKQSCHYSKVLANGKQFNLAVQKLSNAADYLAAVEKYLGSQATASAEY